MGRPKSKPSNKTEPSDKTKPSVKTKPLNKTKPSKESNKKVPKTTKRKRKPTETDDDEISAKNSEHEDEIEDLNSDADFDDIDDIDLKDHNSTEENNYGKFQKYHKDKLWKLNKIAHHLLPAFNKFLVPTVLSDYREYPLLKISLPQSVYVNSKFHDDIDPCHRRTIALHAYMSRLKIIKAAYIGAKKRNKKVRKDEKKGVICKPLIDYAEWLEFNPDKHFRQDYDFYYTGGNLSVNNRLSQVAHVGGQHMNTLVLSVINVQQNIPKLHKLTSVDFKSTSKEETEIFEVQFSSANDDNIFLRQKPCVSIQRFRNGRLKLLQNFRSKEVPFISFTQDPVDTNHIIITDLVHKVRVCDIEKGTPIQILKMMPRNEVKPENNWNKITSLDHHVYIYAAYKKLSIIDTRTPQSEWESSCYGISKDSACYKFCSLARSKFDNLFYIGATHKAYCVDRRYLSKDIDGKGGAVVTWTHQMSSFPLMMATMQKNDAEYITLQSPLSSDMRICENLRIVKEPETNKNQTKKPRLDVVDEYVYKSHCLPYMPPSIESTFHQARLVGKCIKQGTGMCERVKSCITGLDFIEDFPSSYLVTATSNGDIFVRHMYNPDEIDVKPYTDAEVMNDFEENIFRSVRKTPLEMTEVNDLSGISKVFRCSRLSNPTEPDILTEISTKRRYMGRWQKSIRTLSNYKDALATDLISIWDFEVEDVKDFNIASLNRTEPDHMKVSGWLEDTPDIAHSTMLNMTSIPLDVFNASQVSTGPNEVSFTDIMNNSTPQIDLDQSAEPSKPKSAKKKGRYIKGF